MAPDRLVRRINGPRGSSLLALGLGGAPFAIAYSPLTTPPVVLPVGLGVISAAIPIAVYGAVWLVAVVVAWCAAWTDKSGHQRDRTDRLAWGLFVGLLFVWATAYFIGWILYLNHWPPAATSRNSYLQAGIYYGFALFVAICARAMPCREADLETMRQVRYRRPRRSDGSIVTPIVVPGLAVRQVRGWRRLVGRGHR